MFKILKSTFRTGTVTAAYPQRPAAVSEHFRGRPHFDFERWNDARPAAAACPTGAIAIEEAATSRRVIVDYGRCNFCGLCAGAAVTVTQDFELAARSRQALVQTADYALKPNGTQAQLVRIEDGSDQAGEELKKGVHKLLGRSLSIRQVDAGSCNGCELEIGALNNAVHDIERFGIHFVASPRHADMLLVTGPVTRNMEQALRKTYAATPDPKVVAAVGACGISGGIFGTNYATTGAVDRVVPVDVYIPGCPPRPQALIHGILLAIGRLEEKLRR
ncbi:MAG TPA: NADH-quinone oxidoreductase subunit NuoB [Bryobacteraceae bacterium]|nr:NADH-quinone oxidoreductase subunit NuoB [Bryobacteraceae bacterium]